MIYRFLISASFLVFTFACKQNTSNLVPEEVMSTIDSLKTQYAPDGRVAIFKIDVQLDKDRNVLSGETDQSEALDALNNAIAEYDVEQQVVLLPDASAAEYPFAVVNNSVANLRSNPKHSAELATQAILGTALKVLKITDEWYMVQTPDDYIAWVDHGGVQLKSSEEFAEWQSTKKVIVTQINASVKDDQSNIISDVILGNVLEQVDEQKDDWVVQFPDGRRGLLAKTAAADYDVWLEDLKPSAELVSVYARQLMGIPYLWGGTSSKGMDCSGFTKTVYLMNGLIIPRDASQQVHAGAVVDENLTFEGLEVGDLLFFGKPATDSTKQRTTHVGIWLGNDEFIHASQRVRVSSINPNSPHYDEFNKNRYLGSRRYLNNLEGNIVDMKTVISSPK